MTSYAEEREADLRAAYQRGYNEGFAVGFDAGEDALQGSLAASAAEVRHAFETLVAETLYGIRRYVRRFL